MDVPNIPPGPLSRETAERLSRLLVTVTQNQAGGYPATPPPSFHGGAWVSESVSDDYVNRTLWARLTDYDGTTGWYAWEEVISTSPDTTETPVYETKPGGRTGTTGENPAWEKNGLQVDYQSQPVVGLRREHWREDVGWCWVFEAGVAEASFTPADPPTDGSQGAITFNETDVYCIADVLRVYNRVVTVQITGGVLNRSYGNWEYSHDAGCCACDTVTTCCAPCDDTYLHVAVQTGGTGIPSCYDCLDLQFQYDPATGQWVAETCKGASCCDEQFPARIFMDIEGVYEYDGSVPPGTSPPPYQCQEIVDQVGTTKVMTYAGPGGFGNVAYGVSFEGEYAGGTWGIGVSGSLCSNQYWIRSDGVGGIFSTGTGTDLGYVEQFAINSNCVGVPPNGVSGSVNGGSAFSDFNCVGTIVSSVPFLFGGVIYTSAYGVKPCVACTSAYMVATFYTATVDDDGETPCPCVTFRWACDTGTNDYELTVEYDGNGTTVATVYQPAASPDPCVGQEWVYENVALPDGSSATIYVNCEPTRVCANEPAGSGSGGGSDCYIERVNFGSTLGVESISLSGVVAEEGQLLVAVVAYRATAAITPDVYFENSNTATDIPLTAAESIFASVPDLALGVFTLPITATEVGNGSLVATVTGATRVAVIVFAVENLAGPTVCCGNVDLGVSTTPNADIGPLATSDCQYLCVAIATVGGSEDAHGTWATDWTDGGLDVGGSISDPSPIYLCEGYQVYEQPGGGAENGGKTGMSSRSWVSVGVAFY